MTSVQRIGLIALWVAVACLPAAAQTVVPSDPASVGYLKLPAEWERPHRVDVAEDLNAAEALSRVEQVRGFLESFRNLTERLREEKRVSEEELGAFGNTSREMQQLGFHSIPVQIEGTLLKQAYDLAQARYELAQLRQARGRGTRAQVAAARQVYAEATKRMQAFLDTKGNLD
jgi:hypothetical protein